MAGWLSPNWGFRKKISIQNANVDSNLTDFPLYVPIKADADFHEARGDGFDIRFTSSNGLTLLKYEREAWAGGGGGAATADQWVKCNPLAASMQEIYCYYGYAAAGDGQDKNNVWDANFQAVWHLNTDFTDSTGNGYTLTPSGAGVTHETGIIADGAEFLRAANEYADVASAPVTAAPCTLEGWCNVATGDIANVVLSIADSSSDDNYFTIALFNVGDLFRVDARRAGLHDTVDAVNTFNRDVFNYSVGTFTNSTSRASYGNADIANKGTSVANVTPIGLDRTAIGAIRRLNLTGEIDGIIDEVRISDIVRSEAYIKFVYNNINEGDNELTWGAEEERPTGMSPAVFHPVF